MSSSHTSRVHLIDGSGYIFRAYHAMRHLSNSRGMPTNAIYGFTRMLLALLTRERPEYAAMAFDTRDRGERARIYPQYKANRPEPPEDLRAQFDGIHRMVEAFNIKTFRIPGFEADDIIATLVGLTRSWGLEPVVVSADKDLMQLVTSDIRLLDPMKGKVFGPDEVQEKFGVSPEMLTDLLALAGDSSDNIPGVAGIGPKSAADYLNRFGSLEGVLAAAEEIGGKRGKTLIEQKEQALLSRELVRLRTDAPLDVAGAVSLRLGAQNQEQLADLFQELEFTSLSRELDMAIGTPPPGPGAPPRSRGAVAATENRGRNTTLPLFASEEARSTRGGGIEPPSAAPPHAPPGGDNSSPGESDHRKDYFIVLDREELQKVVEEVKRSGELAIDTETTSRDPMDARLVGVSLSWGPGRACYIPVGHYYLGVAQQLPWEQVLEELRPLLEDPDLPKSAQNSKYDDIVLRRHGVEMKGVSSDPMLSSYLLDPGRVSHGLDNLSREFLGIQAISYKEVTADSGPGGRAAQSFSEVELERATQYAAEDADLCLRLTRALDPMVEEGGLQPLLGEMELPLARILATMEMNGVLIDTTLLGAMSGEFEGRLSALEKAIHQAAGVEFLINSPKQLGEVLFDHLGLPQGKKTKTGRSTDVNVLEGLRYLHQVPALVLDYRSLAKLKNTYVDALPRMVNPRTGRLHTCFNQTVAATGRLSSTNPNLQNIPIRTEEGKRIRTAFIARPGHLLLSADYSQIELRILAHMSQDPVLVESFNRGEDIHARTASEIFGVLPGLVSPEQRRTAKAINFGIIYGMSAFRLARDLGIPQKKARAYMENYFNHYAGVRQYLDQVVEDARRGGMVSTMAGRKRYLPGLASPNAVLRSQAERMALNTPIQGSAADVIKKAMLETDRRLRGCSIPATMLLQVHDELVLEVPEDQAEQVRDLVVESMEGAAQLQVPLRVDACWGKNWSEAH